MKFLSIFSVLIFLTSCASFCNSNNYEKCKDKCYEQYQLAVKPCQNSLYGEECKEPLDEIYQDCLKQCKAGYNNAERNAQEDRRKNRQEKYRSGY